ncbi:MAG: hypothetical protein JST00_40610 [Deltaproteobacteria bacterium]|nr:hypothetical protein [Deltaproteobacteria bacterium]
MRGWRAWLFGVVVVLALVRLGLFIVRTHGPADLPPASPSDPEGLSERNTRRAQQAASIAVLLDASPRELEERIAFDEARRSASGALRAIGSDATAAGAGGLAYAAMELADRLAKDVTRACARRGTEKLDEALAALDPEKRKAFEDRVEIAKKSLDRACKLAPRPSE